MESSQDILTFIGGVVAYGGVAAAVAYVLFRFFGRKWIENKFAKNLEAYKHTQVKELEEVKFKINSLFSRVTKIHEKEFEVLSEAWSKLIDVENLLSYLVAPYEEHPDLDKMPERQLNEFLKKSNLSEFEKDELRNNSNKNDYYYERNFWHKLNDGMRAFSEFHLYIQKNQIFLSSDLKNQFVKIKDIMWEVLIYRRSGHRYDKSDMWTKAFNKMKEEIAPIKQKIEELVQSRLHYHEVD